MLSLQLPLTSSTPSGTDGGVKVGKLKKQIEKNKRKILRVLEKRAPLSISEISKLTNIPQSTVWFYVNKYLKDKIVRK